MSIHRAVLAIFLASMAALLVSCGDNPAGPSGSSAVHIVVIRANSGSFSFDPVNEVVHVGQLVAWRNEDSSTHSLVDDAGMLNTGPIVPGATSAAVAYSTSATIEYHCSDQPSMKGLLSINP
jgi:plastocyanin